MTSRGGRCALPPRTRPPSPLEPRERIHRLPEKDVSCSNHSPPFIMISSKEGYAPGDSRKLRVPCERQTSKQAVVSMVPTRHPVESSNTEQSRNPENGTGLRRHARKRTASPGLRSRSPQGLVFQDPTARTNPLCLKVHGNFGRGQPRGWGRRACSISPEPRTIERFAGRGLLKRGC